MQSFGKTKSGAYPTARGRRSRLPPSDVYPYTPGARGHVRGRTPLHAHASARGERHVRLPARRRQRLRRTGQRSRRARRHDAGHDRRRRQRRRARCSAAGFGITYSTVHRIRSRAGRTAHRRDVHAPRSAERRRRECRRSTATRSSSGSTTVATGTERVKTSRRVRAGRGRGGADAAAVSSSSVACARLSALSGSPPSMRAISATRASPSSTVDVGRRHAARGVLAHADVVMRARRDLRQVRDREHLMVLGHAAHRVAHLQSDLAADAGVDLVEHERRHVVEPREDGLERQHHAGQLAARRHPRQRTRLVAHVERDAELHVLGAVGADLRARRERHVEVAVGHAEIGEHLVHRARETGGRRRAFPRERRGRAVERLRRAVARGRAARAGRGSRNRCRSSSRRASRPLLHDLGEGRPVLLDQPEQHVAARCAPGPVAADRDRRPAGSAPARGRGPRARSTPRRTTPAGAPAAGSMRWSWCSVRSSAPSCAQHALLIGRQSFQRGARQPAQLVGVLETVGLLLQACVLAVDQLRVVDLAGHVAQVVGAPLRRRRARCSRSPMSRRTSLSAA